MADQMNTKILYQTLKERLTLDDIRSICLFLAEDAPHSKDLEYEGLQGSGVFGKSLSLIEYCRKHHVFSYLIGNIHYIRPDVLNTNYSDWQIWASDQDTGNPELARQERLEREDRARAAKDQADRKAREAKEQAEREAREKVAKEQAELAAMEHFLFRKFKARQHNRVIAEFDRAIQLEPNDATHYYNRGMSYLGNGDRLRAQRDFRRAADLGHVEAREELAKL